MYKLCNDNKNFHDYLNKKHRNKYVKYMVAWITLTFLGAKNFQSVLEESSTAKCISEINKATALDNLFYLNLFLEGVPKFWQLVHKEVLSIYWMTGFINKEIKRKQNFSIHNEN